ncbi:hypothetical protein BDZ91DRAFT_804930 [Kalaharituber pfeilii]|nr:hypothetical protein BDZ91DRAFT_804930 [Kalaharituber pfeilii]
MCLCSLILFLSRHQFGSGGFVSPIPSLNLTFSLNRPPDLGLSFRHPHPSLHPRPLPWQELSPEHSPHRSPFRRSLPRCSSLRFHSSPHSPTVSKRRRDDEEQDDGGNAKRKKVAVTKGRGTAPGRGRGRKVSGPPVALGKVAGRGRGWPLAKGKRYERRVVSETDGDTTGEERAENEDCRPVGNGNTSTGEEALRQWNKDGTTIVKGVMGCLFKDPEVVTLIWEEINPDVPSSWTNGDLSTKPGLVKISIPYPNSTDCSTGSRLLYLGSCY